MLFVVTVKRHSHVDYLHLVVDLHAVSFFYNPSCVTRMTENSQQKLARSDYTRLVTHDFAFNIIRETLCRYCDLR